MTMKFTQLHNSQFISLCYDTLTVEILNKNGVQLS